MTKNIYSLLFSLFFVAIIATPTIASYIEIDAKSVSILENNEEENKGQENIKDFEIQFYVFQKTKTPFSLSKKRTTIFSKNKNYISFSKELHLPPPKDLI